MYFRNALLVCATTISAYSQTQSAPSGTPIVRRQLPPDVSLQGLWQVKDVRTGKILGRFNINQTGDAVTIQYLAEGKPDQLFYEGTLLNRGHIDGKTLDFRSQRWMPMEIGVIDSDTLRDNLGTILKRATPWEAASFMEYRRVSLLPVPAAPFNLNGVWTVVEDGSQVAITQNQGEIMLTTTRPGQPPFFNGSYTANPTITGRLARWSTSLKTLELENSTITVISPDHISLDNKLLYRQSNPASRDLPCDAQNSNRVRDYYAWVRGATASREGDYQTAKCWLTIGANYEFAPAQSTLAALLLQDSTPDYARAFDLVTRAASQSDVPAELQLASLYREGKGTAPDPVKARYWQQKAEAEKSAEMAKLLTTPGIAGFTPMDIGRMILDGAEGIANSNPMAGASCYNEMFVSKHPCK
jgi:hypothetical protein